MSPEQAIADTSLDGRTDVYSLAVVLYEMLAGVPPFTGATSQAVIARALTERPPNVRASRPKVPEQIATAIEQALEKLPADRFISAEQFAEALRLDSAVGRPSRAGGPVFERGWRDRIRDPIVLGLAALSVGTLSFTALRARRPATDEGRLPVRFPITVGPDEEIDANSQFAVSPNGRLIAFTVRNQTGRQIYIRDVGKVENRILPGTEQALAPFFSPDGEWLGFLTSDGRLKRTPVNGGPVIDLAQIRNNPTQRPTLTPDRLSTGTWLSDATIVVSSGERLMVVSAADGSAKPLLPLDSANGEIAQRIPRALPDGTVLFVSWRGSPAQSKLAIASREGRRVATLDVEAGEPIGFVQGYLIYLRNGVLMGVALDLDTHRVVGKSVPLEDLARVRGVVRAALSPSGVLVYRPRGAIHQIMQVGMEGDRRVLIADERTYGAPRFSPDGKRLALGIIAPGSQDVWVYDLASGTPVKLTTGGTNQRPAWSRDGQFVLFISNRGGRNELWWQRPDLSDSARKLQSIPDGEVNSGLLTRDSLLIYSTASADQPGDIWYRRLRGDTTPRPIAVSRAAEVGPALSADGKWIAYVSNDDDGAQVYVQPFPPTGARYKVTAAGGVSPVWAPDGKRLYYVSGSQLHVATLRTTPSFAVLSRAEAFEGSIQYDIISPLYAFFDVSPDGKHFALLRPAPGHDTRLVVAHGWEHELSENEMNPQAIAFRKRSMSAMSL